MSQWKCKTDDGELGPVSFQELADLVREGTVTEGALVRRDGAGNSGGGVLLSLGDASHDRFSHAGGDVDGETIDCYFPLVGRCTMLECGLLYVDVVAVAALATWHAVGKRGG